MNFFEAQDEARRASRRLVFAYIAATLLIVASVAVVVSFVMFMLSDATYRATFGSFLLSSHSQSQIIPTSRYDKYTLLSLVSTKTRLPPKNVPDSKPTPNGLCKNRGIVAKMVPDTFRWPQSK